MTQPFTTVTEWLAKGRPTGVTIDPHPECPRRVAHQLAESWGDRTFRYSVSGDDRRIIEALEKQ